METPTLCIRELRRGKKHVYETNCDESKVQSAKGNKMHGYRLSGREQDKDAIRKEYIAVAFV